MLQQPLLQVLLLLVLVAQLRLQQLAGTHLQRKRAQQGPQLQMRMQEAAVGCARSSALGRCRGRGSWGWRSKPHQTGGSSKPLRQHVRGGCCWCQALAASGRQTAAAAVAAAAMTATAGAKEEACRGLASTLGV